MWEKHPANFGRGGAQMYALDVDGDGDADIITSLYGHGYGLQDIVTGKRFWAHGPKGDPDPPGTTLALRK